VREDSPRQVVDRKIPYGDGTLVAMEFTYCDSLVLAQFEFMSRHDPAGPSTQRVGPFFLAAQKFCTLVAHCGGD